MKRDKTEAPRGGWPDHTFRTLLPVLSLRPRPLTCGKEEREAKTYTDARFIKTYLITMIMDVVTHTPALAGLQRIAE